MLWTIFVALLVLWVLAVFSGHTVGGFIHILLVIAIVVMLVRIFKGHQSEKVFAQKTLNKGN
ncbi:MAG: lmo0937 family membrane protein [Calditrichaeota bacterium]|nr:MAG: lmo0937 family membrane protein [Calditrichota bacterium]